MTEPTRVEKRLVSLRGGRLQAEVVRVDRPDKTIFCFSTQVGCPVGCGFCAAGGPTAVSLTADEMVYQVDQLSDAPTRERVIYSAMGEGEPSLNAQAVVRALQVLGRRPGAQLAVSTTAVGYLGTLDLVRAEYPARFKMQVSLHGNNAARRVLMPRAPSLAALRPLADLPVPVEWNWTPILGINDAPWVVHSAVKELDFSWFAHAKVNRFNQVEGRAFRPGNVQAVVQAFEREGWTAEVYETDGADQLAACGQLRGRRLEA